MNLKLILITTMTITGGLASFLNQTLPKISISLPTLPPNIKKNLLGDVADFNCGTCLSFARVFCVKGGANQILQSETNLLG